MGGILTGLFSRQRTSVTPKHQTRESPVLIRFRRDKDEGDAGRSGEAQVRGKDVVMREECSEIDSGLEPNLP
jgi:hypothetical protein